MGCSSSKTLSSTIGSTINKLDPIAVPTNALYHHQETRSIENCIVVWLVASSAINAHTSVAEKLRQVICTLRIFNSPDECVSFIESIQDEKVFLIVSPEMEQAVRSVHYLPQLEKIYVFYASSENMENVNDQSIQTTTFWDIDELCEQLREDVKICELDLINVIVLSAETQPTVPFSVSAKQTAMFLCTQLIKNSALRFKSENERKGIFLDFCRPYYAQLDEQVQVLDDFQNNYRPQNVLRWVSKFCFVSRILHRVLRTYELDIVYKMSYVIKHTHTQLALLQEKIFSVIKDPHIVYRGKSMSNDEFNMLVKNNCGGLLSISNFFTANIHKNNAIDFVCRRIVTHPKMVGILFEIYLDLTTRSTANVYALLDNLNSNIKSEEGEIWFTMGTVFRIESVEQVTDNSTNIWIVKLTFVDDNDQQFYRLVAPLRTIDVDSNPFSYFGKLLIEMGASDRAEQFYLDLQNDPSVFGQPRRFALLHSALGRIFTYKGEHIKALEHYQMSLKISLTYMPPDHPDLASIYKSIGSSYFNDHNYAQALQNYERGAQLLNGSAQQVDEHLVVDLNDSIVKMKQLLEHNK